MPSLIFDKSTLLPQSFFARDVHVVALELIGKYIRREDVVLRITEVEAYSGPNDTASHCRFGRTKRNAAMWGPPGHAYVYLCYGMHHMLNFVTNGEGEGAAVLIRSCETAAGLDTIRERRNGLLDAKLVTGPGNIGAALALSRDVCHEALFTLGSLEVHDGIAPKNIRRGPRIGIGYASKSDQDALLRFADGDSACVSEKKTLR